MEAILLMLLIRGGEVGGKGDHGPPFFITYSQDWIFAIQISPVNPLWSPRLECLPPPLIMHFVTSYVAGYYNSGHSVFHLTISRLKFYLNLKLTHVV